MRNEKIMMETRNAHFLEFIHYGKGLVILSAAVPSISNVRFTRIFLTFLLIHYPVCSVLLLYNDYISFEFLDGY